MDPDDDGFVDELTRADVTAASVFQAQLAVPGRVIPDDPGIEVAVLVGQQVFGEAEASNQAWQAASDYQRDAVIEFLKTLQVLPEGTRHRVVNERGHRKRWPPR